MSYRNNPYEQAERQAPSKAQMQRARHMLEMVLAGEVDRFEVFRCDNHLKYRPIHEGKTESA